MSADNGVYILRTPSPRSPGFEFRVAHAQSIEVATSCDQQEADHYIVQVFGRSWVLHRKGRAKAIAHLIQDDIVATGGYTQYGVQVIEVNRPFPGHLLR